MARPALEQGFIFLQDNATRHWVATSGGVHGSLIPCILEVQDDPVFPLRDGVASLRILNFLFTLNRSLKGQLFFCEEKVDEAFSPH